jgi:hypothetical protein
VPWTVAASSEVEKWALSLDHHSFHELEAALRILADHGPGLGRPLVDSVRGSRHHNMKELRPGSSGRATDRVLFAFDHQRVAVLLVGGDKTNHWESWYREAIPRADSLLDKHLAGEHI